MKKDKKNSRKIILLKSIDNRNYDVIQLKECPRVKFSLDMPLKKPTSKCVFRKRGRRECMMHPSLLRYLHENGIEYHFATKFKCVIMIGGKNAKIQS